MADHPNCVLEWPYLYKEKSTEELTQSLWSTTMELEATRIRVQEEIRARDDQLKQLKDLLNDAINERNEAQSKYQSLLLDKLVLQQQFQHHRRYTHHQTTTPPLQSGLSSIEDEPITNCASDCEESIVSSPPMENPVRLATPPQQELRFPVVPTKGNPKMLYELHSGNLWYLYFDTILTLRKPKDGEKLSSIFYGLQEHEIIEYMNSIPNFGRPLVKFRLDCNC
ncbi:hypothetical protein L2E82_33095 [Cichorium intybus]|uniref:Uncharacterized protein n=1 Tax=Cichorium intybus TaxID=13427 RepID=A0ACB9BJ89_CICIN|nr:hypothetical protein L2E82_33095 [Cichorium intybus]